MTTRRVNRNPKLPQPVGAIPPMDTEEFLEIKATLGLTFEAMALRIGCSERMLYRYAKGARVQASRALLLRGMAQQAQPSVASLPD